MTIATGLWCRVGGIAGAGVEAPSGRRMLVRIVVMSNDYEQRVS
ncbi:MAG TPA: hypothetical protein VG778_07390 [Blastocatellia bacterium]|nr:hypothetical protein [Blastocatellia bacterium]